MRTRTARELDRAFVELYVRHRPELLKLVRRDSGDEAEDDVQTAFLDAYRAMKSGTAPRDARAWLSTIALNAVRRRFRPLRARLEEPGLDVDGAASPEPAVDARDIRDALRQLPYNQRAALLLRELGGFSYAEIAERLDVSVPAVQMLLFRARRTLRAELAPPRLWAVLPVPSWLSQLLPSAERLAPATRVVGVVVAVAVGAGLVSSQAQNRPGAVPVARAEVSVVTPSVGRSVHHPLPERRARPAAEPSNTSPPSEAPAASLPDDDAAPAQAAEKAPPTGGVAPRAPVQEQPAASAPAPAQPPLPPAPVELPVQLPPLPIQPEPPPLPEPPSLPVGPPQSPPAVSVNR